MIQASSTQHTGVKPPYISGFRTLLLTFTLCMLGAVLVVVLILFAQLYTVIGDMENRIGQYITIDQLSKELQTGKNNFMNFFSSLEDEDIENSNMYAQSSSVLRYKALLTVKTLKANYGESPQKYFLNRSIRNGLEFINEKSPVLEKTTGTIQPETYKLYYQLVQVYDYLLQYTNYMYLSAAVSSDVGASLSNIRKIQHLRIISFILLLVIVVASSIGAITITRYLARSVYEMVEMADTITHGNFTTPDLPLTGPREFINLKDKINLMKHSLGERIELEKQLHKQALEHEKITKELEHARYLSLQAQINPHFLFNTLNVISNTALFEHADNSVQLINSLAGIFRYRLEFSNEVTLSAELTFVRQYLGIQQARFGKRLTYQIFCDDTLSNLVIPPFVIQPFVENAVVHGIEPLEKGGTVTVSAKKNRKNQAVITIEDNGTGIPENFTVSFLESEPAQQHIGITNVVNRLTMFFGKHLSICIKRKNKSGGTSVVIQLPLKG